MENFNAERPGILAIVTSESVIHEIRLAASMKIISPSLRFVRQHIVRLFEFCANQSLRSSDGFALQNAS
jgi:hypothetical protein